MDKSVIGLLILKLLVAILLLITYLYIEKLENIGCECSEHPNRQFIKNFSLFGFVYYLITIFINPATLNLGSAFLSAYAVVDLLFFLMIGFYFYFTVDYIRYLINEKCKCSEDQRRELIMGGSIVELLLIVLIFIHAMLLPVTGNCLITVISSASTTKDKIKESLTNPLKSIKESPADIKKSFKNLISTSKSVLNTANKKLIKKTV